MRIAVSDITAGLGRMDLALALAWEDLKDRYRRSYIGLVWIILSFLAFILVKSLIFSGLFDTPGYDFYSHLVVGFALFGFMSTAISGGTNIFVANRTWILSTNLPYTIYAHVLTIRSIFELFLVGITAAVLVLLMGDISPSYIWTLPLAIVPYYLSAIGICLLLGPLGARFRDVLYAVQTLIRILFFATPIIWIPLPGTIRETVAFWNPLTYYLDIVRIPVIEGNLPVTSWAVVLILTFILILGGTIVFSKTKKGIPLWL